jgi:ribonuclease-3
MRAELATLESRIGYNFTNQELLRRAFTHTSFANEARTGHGSPLDDNEQLEFLGDSVLGFLAAEALVERNPEFREGGLSGRKAHLVSAAHLHGVARRLELGAYLDLGRSEEMSGGRAKKTLLVDALEALIAAIYLDGGMGPARAFVATHILDAPFAADEDAGTDVQPAIANFKSVLQELAQARKLPVPRYTIIRESGPEHAKTFTVEVRAGKDWTGQAEGRTKKVAAQRAARAVYERLRASAPGLEPSPGQEGAGDAGSEEPAGPPESATQTCPAS